MNNANKWTIRDGATVIECTSFPYAFRTMFNIIKKGVEKSGRTYNDMVKQLSIVSPIKDSFGENKVYSYTAAIQMATDMGLLTSDGQINSKEFKKQY
jgi:hypothetical protein